MMLPPQLAPWSAWLALLPFDLVAPFGEMLLRLQPLVGRMAGVAASEDDIPVGVGSIARRGPYERLLLSEWAVLDAAPDEFIRRAAANELLFSAPEPQVQRRARVCVALFDAGPEQLGEPRLVQMALFILLARRAQLDGASFEWGILQRPGPLHTDCGRHALERLMNARTVARVGSAERDGWNRYLAQVDPLADVWQVDGPGAGTLRRMTARASIEQPLLDDRLQVTITQQGKARQLMLELPDPDSAVRLMRHPASARRDKVRDCMGGRDTPSLKHAPLFSVRKGRVVTSRADGGNLDFGVPDSRLTAPVAPRRQRTPKKGRVIGICALLYRVGNVACTDSTLRFRYFCGAFYDRECALPPSTKFEAPSGPGRWLPTFFLDRYQGGRLFILDPAGRLVCWSAASRSDPDTRFDVIATGVVGAAQSANVLVHARVAGGLTLIECDYDGTFGPVDDMAFPFTAKRVLFGEMSDSSAPYTWLLAFQTTDTQWLLAHENISCTVDIADGGAVVGVARTAVGKGAQPALLVVSPDRTCVELRTATQRYVVLRTALPIAHVTLDVVTDRFCWILTRTHELFVRRLHEVKPLLHVIPDGVLDAP
ncbi:hypothetical protein LXA47_14240 [Massilia sp. P8910]|uniref:hypothetical protein n=1 Tax=Massilia antarctica TaxID=2765360 RepID=UPI001E65585E|nr:hypothetical protein [Massilia antarctica]MCE3604760.1 hypothetical protein [Massilia antarctica]